MGSGAVGLTHAQGSPVIEVTRNSPSQIVVSSLMSAAMTRRKKRKIGERVFVSFEYDRDHASARNLVAQARTRGYPEPISDLSIREQFKASKHQWIPEAYKAIKKCGLFVVLLGSDTHNADGVRREIKHAKKNNRRIIQIRPQGKTFSSHPLLPNYKVIVWKWRNLDPYFDSQYGRHGGLDD